MTRRSSGLDNSTIGGILARLKRRKLLQHAEGPPASHHVDTGGDSSACMSKIMPEVQAAILHPLTARERQQLIPLLSKLVGVNRPYWRHPPFRPHRRNIAVTALNAR